MPLDFLISALVTLVVVVDPIGLAPTFLAVTSGLPDEARRQVALRAPVIAGTILTGTTLIGDWLLRQLGISLPAFRIAGGLLLFSIASEMVLGVRMERQSRAAEQAIEEHVRNIAAFPLATPLLAGPGAITATILLAGQAAPLIADTRRRYESQFAQKDAEVAAREAAVRVQREELATARRAVEAEVTTRLDLERGKIAVAEALEAKRLVETDLDARAKEIAELNEVLRQRDTKLAEAQQAQADLIRKQRELDDAKRELDLTVENRVQAGLTAVRDKTKQETEAALGLRVREKEEQIASMQRQIEELKRKAEQGSQQLQGEVQELALEALLRQRFTRDLIDPVPKGEFGGDLIQRIVGPAGQVVGSILWEAKRTKNWSDGWLGKLREDQRAAKADVCLIVSQALPKGVQTFDYIDGVWVTDPKCALAVAVALRESLVALSAARLAGEGQQTKMEMVYRYLTGPRFRHRIEAVVERFTEMQADLDRERKAMTRLWAKREEQIHGVVDTMAGLYGDLQGIAGRSLQEIEGLQVSLLDGPPASEAAE